MTISFKLRKGYHEEESHAFLSLVSEGKTQNNYPNYRKADSKRMLGNFNHRANFPERWQVSSMEAFKSWLDTGLSGMISFRFLQWTLGWTWWPQLPFQLSNTWIISLVNFSSVEPNDLFYHPFFSFFLFWTRLFFHFHGSFSESFPTCLSFRR